MHPDYWNASIQINAKHISIYKAKVEVYAKKITRYEKHSANDCLPKFRQHDDVILGWAP